LMGISFHPGKNSNGPLFKTAVGRHHRVAFNFGIALGVEYKINNWFSLKLDQAAFRDCAGKFAGMVMFNVRYTQQLGKLGDGSVGLGPFFFFRKSWSALDGYVDEGYFRVTKNKKWETKFVWYGGELEHNYPLKKGLDLSTNIFPGVPAVFAITSGLRFSNPSKE
ncbi:MAG: hypothetical protein M3R17_19845, partial [Bacteroidota bacterium]|nr:hypothetical protein [Bacteroidota bacterium]